MGGFHSRASFSHPGKEVPLPVCDRPLCTQGKHYFKHVVNGWCKKHQQQKTLYECNQGSPTPKLFHCTFPLCVYTHLDWDDTEGMSDTYECWAESVEEGLSLSSGTLSSNTMVSVFARQNPLDLMISVEMSMNGQK